MKRILVTGGSGLIGKSVVKNLLLNNFYVMMLDERKLKDFDKIVQSYRFKFIQGDCRNSVLVSDLVRENDAIIHLAAPSSFLMYKENPLNSTLNTIQSFLNIVEASREHKIRKIVHASTSAVYEGNNLPYIETMKINPPDLKSFSKKINEEIARHYYNHYSLKIISLRPFSVYGDDEFSKGGYANVISLFVWCMVSGKRPIVWGNGIQTRDYIHTDDVAEAFRLAIVKDIDTQEINVGTGKETSFNEVIELINKKLGTNLKPKYVTTPLDIYAQRLLADTKLATKVLGFNAEITLDKGIDQVIKTSKLLIKKKPWFSNMQTFYKTLKLTS